MQPSERLKELYDIYEVWHVPFWHRTWFYVLCSFIVLMILALLMYRYMWPLIQKWFNRPMPVSKRLRLELASLAQKPIHTQEEGRVVYLSMTSIMKEYVDHRFGYAVRGLTDTEFVKVLREAGISPHLCDQMDNLIKNAMVVKFASMDAVQSECADYIRLCIAWIDETTPHPSVKK